MYLIKNDIYCIHYAWDKVLKIDNILSQAMHQVVEKI